MSPIHILDYSKYVIYLVDNSTTTVSTLVEHCEKQEQEKDITMSSQASIRNDEINYLISRIRRTYDELTTKIYEKYLGDDPPPETKEEMEKRFAEGRFIVESTYKDGRYPMLFWRSPDKKKDQEGHDKAMESLNKIYRAAKDAANVLPAAEALKELQKLEEFQV